MTSQAPTRLRACPCGYCAPLREVRRRLAARQNHPIYAARGNEQPLLQELIDAEPPVGGVAAYAADLNCEHDPTEEE